VESQIGTAPYRTLDYLVTRRYRGGFVNGGPVVLRARAHVGSTRRLALAVVPLVAAAFACTATVTDPGDGSSMGSGATATSGGAGPAGGGSQGGASGTSGSKATGGTSGGGTSGTAGDGAGGTSGVPPADEPRPVSMEGAPIYSRFLRLTNDQWENSVHDILRLTAPTGASDGFLHAVSGTTDFDNNERVVTVTDTAWSDFQLAAEIVANQVTATDAALQAVVTTTDPATFIKTFGRRAFRRDLTAAEVTAYTTLYTTGTMFTPSGTQSAFTMGAQLVIMAMLQSPSFLYRSEMGDLGSPLSGYEMAAKLSLWIRDTTPTDAMLDVAKTGTFDTATGATAQATAMLEDPAAGNVMRKFHGQLYKFALYDTISKDNVAGYSGALNSEFSQAAYAFFDYIFSQNHGVKDILTSNVGFAGPGMAALYGLSVSGGGVQQVTLSDRSGFYAQAPFLTLWAINNDPDSIHRGVRINLDTLCADPGVPSATLPAVPAVQPGQTNRDRYTTLTAGCGATCHGQVINPIGFAFENFDGVGRYRDTDNGQPVDASGEYPFAEGMKSFDGSAELMQIMASGTQAHQCWAKKMASYALERDLVEGERPLVESLGAVSLASNASLKQVMLALVSEDAFRTHIGGAP